MSALAEQTAPETLPEMSDATPDAPVDAAPVDAAPADTAPAEPTPRPGAMKFRRKYTTVRLTPEQASRQGQVATSAFRRFGERDAAMAFLNAHDEALGGRPLDLAIASAEGLATVEAAMAERTA